MRSFRDDGIKGLSKPKAFPHTVPKKDFVNVCFAKELFDNSIMENFFSLPKQEFFHGETYHSFEGLKTTTDNLSTITTVTGCLFENSSPLIDSI